MRAAQSRAHVLRHAHDYHSEFVRRPLDASAPGDGPARRRVLLTAPHDAVDLPFDADAPEIRDPLSGALAKELRHALGRRCTLVRARLHRRFHDQNRLHGMLYAADMAPRLRRYRGATDLRDVLHVDVHTYTQARPLSGWGTGVNIIVMHDAPEQRRFAESLASHLTRAGVRETPRVIEMERRPTHARDDESNAVIEWSRAHGALAVLVELPVRRTGAQSALDAEWVVADDRAAMLRGIVAAIDARSG